jgi:hypothetical protein
MKKSARITGALVSLLLAAIVHADGLVRIVISEADTEVGGVTYSDPREAMEALKKLNPEEVRFEPKLGTSYKKVSAILRAFRESGIKARTGFAGNVSE